jgi:diaminopimelate decarboxylase
MERRFIATDTSNAGAYKFVAWNDVQATLNAWRRFTRLELVHNLSSEADPQLLLKLRDAGVTFGASSQTHLERLAILDVPPERIALSAGSPGNALSKSIEHVRPSSITASSGSALRIVGKALGEHYSPTLDLLIRSVEGESHHNPLTVDRLAREAQTLGFKTFGLAVTISEAAGTDPVRKISEGLKALGEAAQRLHTAGIQIESIRLLGGLVDGAQLHARGLDMPMYLDTIDKKVGELVTQIEERQGGRPIKAFVEGGQTLVGHLPIMTRVLNVVERNAAPAVYIASHVYGDLAQQMFSRTPVVIEALPPLEKDAPLTGPAERMIVQGGSCDSVDAIRTDRGELCSIELPRDLTGGCWLAIRGTKIDNGATDFNMIPPARFVLIDPSDETMPYKVSPLADYHAPFFEAATTWFSGPEAKALREFVVRTRARLEPEGALTPGAAGRQESEDRRKRMRSAASELFNSDPTLSGTIVLLDLEEYVRTLEAVSTRLGRTPSFAGKTEAELRAFLAQGAPPQPGRPVGVDRVYVPIKTFCDPIALAVLHATGLGLDTASAGEMELALRAGASVQDMIVSHPHKTPATLDLICDPTTTPWATTIDSAAELQRLIDAGASRDTVLFVRLKARGRTITSDLSSKFGLRFSESKNIDEVTPLLEKAAAAGFSKLGICFHIGTQAHRADDYGTALRHCCLIAERAAKCATPIKLGYFNVGGGWCDERVAVKQGTSGRRVLSESGALIAHFRSKVEAITGERVTIIAEPGRVTCARAGATLSQVLEVYESDLTEMRVRASMTRQGALSGDVHDEAFFDIEALNTATGPADILVQIHGNSNLPRDIFPAIKKNGKHTLPITIKRDDWLVAHEAGVAYGWNAAGAFDGQCPGRLVAFYTDEAGKRRFIESPWSNREALRNEVVRTWYRRGHASMD